MLSELDEFAEALMAQLSVEIDEEIEIKQLAEKIETLWWSLTVLKTYHKKYSQI